MERQKEVLEQRKYIIFKGVTVELKYINGLWRGPDGCIFALRDDTATVDMIDRCGIGIFSLPATHPLTAACRVHDYMYSSPAYQLFNTREKADSILRQMISEIGEGHWYRWLADPFYWISRAVGTRFWENKLTA